MLILSLIKSAKELYKTRRELSIAFIWILDFIRQVTPEIEKLYAFNITGTTAWTISLLGMICLLSNSVFHVLFVKTLVSHPLPVLRTTVIPGCYLGRKDERSLENGQKSSTFSMSWNELNKIQIFGRFKIFKKETVSWWRTHVVAICLFPFVVYIIRDRNEVLNLFCLKITFRTWCS